MQLHPARPRRQERADVDAAIGADEEAVAVHAADDAEWRRRGAPEIEAFDVRGLFAERFGGFGGDAFIWRGDDDGGEPPVGGMPAASRSATSAAKKASRSCAASACITGSCGA